MTSFSDMPLSEGTKKGLQASGYETPTAIQQKTIEHALKGEDVLGAAKTGSGKTLAFVIPMLELLHKEKWSKVDGLGALVISPTRELAYQIFEVLKRVGKFHSFSAGLVIGGKDLKFESKRLNTCNIIICTPGRLLQHMDTNPLFQWDQLKMLILDEADRCLDMGFKKEMDAIIENLPKDRQTLLFSATQTKSVKDLARLSLDNPKFISVDALTATPEGLKQSYTVCEQQDKLDLLWTFLKSHPKQKMIVFMASCKEVKYTYELFCRLKPGTSLLALYGTLHQLRRMAIYDEFCRKQSAILFATDVAARGLDFPAVNWVVQLDCPEDANTYIHRVGRTARFKSDGQSLIVLRPSEKDGMLRRLKEKTIEPSTYVNSRHPMTIRFKAQAFCARDVSLKESAQRAFKAYFKSVHLMKDKEVFNVHSLDKDKYAKSLGLEVTPRIRFLEKGQPRTTRQKQPETKQVSLLMEDDDDDDGEELFTVKSVWRPEVPANLPALEDVKKDQSKKNEKMVTKASVAKKLSKKNILPNKKIVFNDDGEPEESFPTQQKSSKVKELDNFKGGLNLEVAKEIMREEDKIDRQIHRRLLQEKRRKLKDKKRDEARSMRNVLLRNEDDDDVLDGTTDKFIDELPDPERLYGEDSDDEDDKHPKRRRLASSSSSDEAGSDDEEFALQLLSSSKKFN